MFSPPRKKILVFLDALLTADVILPLFFSPESFSFPFLATEKESNPSFVQK